MFDLIQNNIIKTHKHMPLPKTIHKILIFQNLIKIDNSFTLNK